MRQLWTALVVALLVTGSWAYPSKTISLVVPSKAGGSTDATARIFAETAKKYWPDADFIVVNKPGAGGMIGFEYTKRERPDGHTIGLMFTPQFIAHIVSKQASYTLDDFTVVGNVAEDQGIVVVHSDSPIKNLDDLVAAAKTKKLTASVNGIGSDDFLAAKNFESMTDVSFNMIPTKGSTEQKASIMGGHVDVAFMNLSQMLSQHKAGQVRIIAILSKKRADVAPDIATSAEQGYAGLLMTATRGFVIRKDVEASIQEKIIDLFTKVVNDDEFKARCAKTYIFLDSMDGPTYKSYLQELQSSTQKVFDISPW